MSGTSDTNGTLSITDNGQPSGSTAVRGGGKWSFTTATKLSDIVHTFVATEIDGAGNQGAGFALFGSSGNDNLTGDTGANFILGNGGGDVINGFVGADTVDGGAGTDAIYLTATSVDLNTAKNSQIVNVEVVSAADASTGVVIDLSNQSENLAVIGSDLAGTIKDGSGNNTIKGGGGGDALTGGGGKDTFLYTLVTDSKPGAGNFDSITHFKHGSDKIDFSAITQLTKVATATSTPSTIAANTIELVTTGGNTIIYANATGASQSTVAADMEVHLIGVTNVTAADVLHN